MANAFNMLRPNELIWSYYVNNYLKGKEPMPFDLLVWNSDSTRMPAANHTFYLRHCYLQNDLTNGRMTLGGETIDLKKVTIPIYELAANEDHIAPARVGVQGRQMFRRAGALRDGGLRPYRGRRQSRRQAEISVLDRRPARGRVRGLGRRSEGNAGLLVARLVQWVVAQAPAKVAARKPGAGKLKPHLRRAGRICAGDDMIASMRANLLGNRVERRVPRRFVLDCANGDPTLPEASRPRPRNALDRSR